MRRRVLPFILAVTVSVSLHSLVGTCGDSFFEAAAVENPDETKAQLEYLRGRIDSLYEHAATKGDLDRVNQSLDSYVRKSEVSVFYSCMTWFLSVLGAIIIGFYLRGGQPGNVQGIVTAMTALPSHAPTATPTVPPTPSPFSGPGAAQQ